MSKISVSPLYEGTFSVGLDKKFIRIEKDDPPKKGSLKLSINPFLIQEDNRNILFDVGLGEFGEDTSTQTIIDNLETKGVADYEVTDIFASHLHYDHLGGLAGQQSGYWELTFPDANLWVSKNEWDKLTEEVHQHDEDKKDFFHFIEARANLKFLDDEDQPLPNVRVKKIGGHTEFSLALFYENQQNKYVMAGDVVGTRGEINRNFAAKYDYDPKQSMAVREELKKLAFESGYIFMAYHETHHPLFKLTSFDENKGYTIENI
ncbi:MAG: MBL fold metallo-hydrolase [Balneolaceae bacterium]